MRSGNATEKKYLVEGITGGVCLFDYDGDGWLDIYLVNGSSVEAFKQSRRPEMVKNHLFRNRGDGTFEDVTDRAGVGGHGWGMGCCAADFNNDGHPDLYVTNLGPNELYQNNGDGTFRDISEVSGTDCRAWSTGCSWGDFDNDGLLDLYVANYVEMDVTKPPPKGIEKFCSYMGLEVMCGPRGLPPAADRLYRNQGNGTFKDIAASSGLLSPDFYGLGVASFDFDNDGKLDIFVANDSTPNLLYRNRGDGTFAEVGLIRGVAVNEDGVEQACMGVAVGDYDNDGNLDLFVTNFAEDTNTLYRNLGNGFFVDVTTETRMRDSFPYMGWGTVFFDYDNDGWKDLFVANGHLYPEVETRKTDQSYRQTSLLYRNDGKGSFVNVSRELGYGKRLGRGAACGDLNNDGKIDLVVSNLDDRPCVLFNTSDNSNHWILVRLVGRSSNRDAIGSRVWIETDKGRQTEEVLGGSSYLSSNDLRVHFGLGRTSKISSLFVRWPNGFVQRLEDVKADQILTIRQPR